LLRKQHGEKTEPEGVNRVLLVQTRLGKAQVQTVMEKNNTEHKEEVLLWMHCCRSLFGGSAVSLRFIAPLDERMRASLVSTGADTDLTNILLSKVPTISRASAQDFVTAFLAAVKALHQSKDLVSAVASAGRGPINMMVQAALLTRDSGVGIDFPDFVSSATGLHRAYDGPPALRIAAWCCHLRASAKAVAAAPTHNELDSMALPQSVFDSMLVDQYGFPLQLRDPPDMSFLRKGRAFSWNGDYTRIHDIIDAVKRGHSVDWMDVHRRCWSLKLSPVLDGGALVKLLSVCNSPGSVLAALTKENLCTLLKKSTPEDTLAIAGAVLNHQIGKNTIQDDGMYSPWSLALWMLIVHEETIRPEQLIERMGGEKEATVALVWASKNMSDWRTVYGKIDPQQRGVLVWRILLRLSTWLMKQKRFSELPSLWQNIFAPLLRVAGPTDVAGQEDDVRLSDVALCVVIEAEDCNSNWDSPVQSMWAVLHRKATPTQLSELWQTGQPLFYAMDDGSGRLHPKVCAGVLSMPRGSSLPMDLKLALLQTGSDVRLEDLDDVTGKTSVALLSDAIQQIEQQEDKSFNIPDGAWCALVHDAAKQFE